MVARAGIEIPGLFYEPPVRIELTTFSYRVETSKRPINA